MSKQKKRYKFGVLFLVCTMLLNACGNTDRTLSVEKCPYDEFIVVDVFDGLANFQGIQSGWFGKVIKDKFNMELNIIAPNITGGGNTLFEVRAAAGNLGDLIIGDTGTGSIQNLVNAGLLYNMEEALTGKQIMKYQEAIESLNQEITPKGIYVIPSEVSGNPPDEPSESVEPTFGPYLRWDLYARLGYPQMDTMEDLLPVLAKMQELLPVSEEGYKTYAFSFFKEWDDNMMNAVKQPCCMYGYDEEGFVLARADGTDYQNILDDESLYIRMCRFFAKANQMGLVDPESKLQNYEECFEKYNQGRILFSPWPWLGQSAYNTAERTSQGKGFMMAPIKDLEIYSYGCGAIGNNKTVIAVGSKAKDPQRLVDFIDWLYSPEGISMNGAQLSGSTAGPEGLTWEMGEDGPYLTEFGKEALFNGEAVMPEEMGGGTWQEGTSILNFKSVAQCERSPDGYYYAFEMWDSVQQLKSSKLAEDWRRVMKADSTREYLEQNDMIVVSPGCVYKAPEETAEQVTIRNQCQRAIRDYSWEMVFASDEEEFDRLLKELQDTVQSFGYETILAYDMANAKAKQEAKQQAVAKSRE